MTSVSSPQIPYMPCVRMQAPALVSYGQGDLPWLSFSGSFGAFLTFQFRQAVSLPLPIYDLQSNRTRLITAGSTNHETALQREYSIQKLKLGLQLVNSEVHEGDHLTSAEILLTGSQESASIELLESVVYLLSNNMEYELDLLMSGQVRDPVDAL
ncbi:hypothetical protein F5Y05DRAFT_385062 [Hypoxylon sp. FL0543]|nr:hypothetical protein F5Y05DRAFT_385062 [Hypoxylon sp. FL0543]